MKSKLKDKINAKTNEENKIYLDMWNNNKLKNPYTNKKIKENSYT